MWFFSLPLILFLIFSCASIPPRPQSPLDWKSILRSQTLPVRAFQGQARLIIRFEKQLQRLQSEVRFKPPETLELDAFGPFGIFAFSLRAKFGAIKVELGDKEFHPRILSWQALFPDIPIHWLYALIAGNLPSWAFLNQPLPPNEPFLQVSEDGKSLALVRFKGTEIEINGRDAFGRIFAWSVRHPEAQLSIRWKDDLHPLSSQSASSPEDALHGPSPS